MITFYSHKNMLKSSSVYFVLVQLLFFQFVVFPKIFMPLKAAFIFILVCLSLNRRNFSICYNPAVKVSYIYILYNLFSTIYGFNCGYGDVALKSSTVNIIWPIAFVLFCGEIVTENTIKNIFVMLVRLAQIIIIMDIILVIAYFLHSSFLLGLFNQINLNPVFIGNFGIFQIRVDHLYFYAFFSPFLIYASIMSFVEKKEFAVKNFTLYLTTIFSIVLSLLSGMGGVWLSMGVGVGLCIFKSGLLQHKSTYFAVLLIGLIVIISGIYSYSNEGLVFRLINAVSDQLESENNAYSVRASQRALLIDGWMNNPLFGNGIGAPIKYDRNGIFDVFYESESSYHVILYQKGFVGLLLFVLVFLNARKVLVNSVHFKRLYMPFYVGMVSFLIANAFNPYLASLSTIWILFLPIIFASNPLPQPYYIIRSKETSELLLLK